MGQPEFWEGTQVLGIRAGRSPLDQMGFWELAFFLLGGYTFGSHGGCRPLSNRPACPDSFPADASIPYASAGPRA